MIDIRSDTVTKPSKEMLEVIVNSEVGDVSISDGYGGNRPYCVRILAESPSFGELITIFKTSIDLGIFLV